MRHAIIRLSAAIAFITGLIAFLGGIEVIDNSTISENLTLQWMAITTGFAMAALSIPVIIRPATINSHRAVSQILACIALLIIPNVVLLVSWYPSSGFDLNIGCSAVTAYDDGFDPYIVQYLQMYSASPYSFPYPPISLVFFELICCGDHRIVYYIIWALLLTATFLTVKKTNNSDPFLILVVLCTGFVATFLNFFTGNLGIPQLLFFSIIIALISKDRYYPAAILMGLMASLKLWPLALGALFLLAPRCKTDKIKLCSVLLISFGIVHLISYLAYPEITASYYDQVIGRIDSQHTPINEATEGSIANPSLVLGVKTLSSLLFNNNVISLVILEIIYVAFIAFSFTHYLNRQKGNFLNIFCIGTLAILLISPRLQLYSFVFALIPVYFLIKDFDLKNKFIFLFIISAFPLIFMLTSMMTAFHSTDPANFIEESIFADDTNLPLVSRITCYGQGISLLIFYIYFLIKDESFGLAIPFSDALKKLKPSGKHAA